MISRAVKIENLQEPRLCACCGAVPVLPPLGPRTFSNCVSTNSHSNVHSMVASLCTETKFHATARKRPSRFVAATGFPTVTAAEETLGLRQPVLHGQSLALRQNWVVRYWIVPNVVNQWQ